jgi:uncharacterized membrane protein YgcG
VNFWHRCLAYFLSFSLVFAANGCAQQQPSVAVSDQGGIPGEHAYHADQITAQPTSPATRQSAEQLQQLVAPIALYPDALVAQVLAASTYPTEIVEADRWMQQHPDLKGQALAQAVDQQPWDPSVKALAQFPSVLANLDKNLSWTSALGEAYVNQPQDVLNAVQTMRQRAVQAGNLQSNAQQTVTTQGQTIIVQPADPGFVYVPAYDPWLVYGAPVVAYPWWVTVPGVYVDGPGIYFGAGFGIGFFGGFGWGWPAWGFDWHGRRMMYHHAVYVSHSRTFFHHGFDHGQAGHAGFEHATFGHEAEHGDVGRFGFDDRVDHGGLEHGGLDHESQHDGLEHGGFDHEAEHDGLEHGGLDHGADFGGSGNGGFDHGAAFHASTFSGFDHGATALGNSSRGHSSFGGGFHGGGFGGGGGHGGGGHR